MIQRMLRKLWLTHRSTWAMTALLAWVPHAAALTQEGHLENNRTYQQVCARCHETPIAPRLLGRQLPQSLVELMVRHGKNAMPAFRPSEISDEELTELAKMIEKTSTTQAKP